VKIFILRHGKAEAPIAGASDKSRNLSDKGVQQVEKIASWMKIHDYLPQLILSSPYNRALQTAEIIKKKLNIAMPIQLEDSLIYGEDPRETLALLESLTVDSVLFSSHMPLVAELTRLFAPGSVNEGFHTAEIIKIRFDRKNQHGVVTANISPKEI